MSVASSAIVGNAPAHRAGMAASIEEVAYEFGNLLAVALLGSLMAALFSAGLQVPAGVAETARAGIAEALALAAADPEHGARLAAAATDAYDRGYRVVMIVITGVLTVGAGTCAILLRRHGPGSLAFRPATH